MVDGARQAARPLRQQHENQAFAILGLFWRRRQIIAGTCFAALMIGGVTTFFVQSQYTAEVLLKPRLGLAHQDPKKQRYQPRRSVTDRNGGRPHPIAGHSPARGGSPSAKQRSGVGG